MTDGGSEDELRQRWQDADAAAVVGEGPSDRKRRERIESALEKTPRASAEEIAGRLGLPPDTRGFIEEVRVGVDRSEPVAFDDSVPEWRVKSVTIDGEERLASAGKGGEMVAVMGEGERWRAHHGGGREWLGCGVNGVVSGAGVG